MSNDHDELMQRVSALRLRDLSSARREQIGAVCRRRLARHRRPGWSGVPGRLVPAALGVLAAGYLSWAVEQALVLLGIIAKV